MWPFPLLMLLPCCAALLHHQPPPPPAAVSRNTPVEGVVNVRLNHFDASNTDTFPMRYYYNSELANNTGHVVIFAGGEWEIDSRFVTGGLSYELAQRLGAALFYTEHRYYGKTRPTDTTEVSALRFLNVDQALADLAEFIEHIKSDQFEEGKYKDGKVLLVGCSYSASMATWMRITYPHLVDGAFADSGPLHAQEDFPEYLEVITEVLRSEGGEVCVSSVEESMQALVAMLETSNGPQEVSNLFNLCAPFQATSPLDLATFFWFGITETFAYLVQYAIPGDVSQACATLTNSTVEDPVQRLAVWITAQSMNQPCIEGRYEQQVILHTNLTYDSPTTTMRLWTYQTCVEFGWYQTTTSSRQPFLTAVPLEYFFQMCKDFFSAEYEETRVSYGVERTNTLYGGRSARPDHVVSVAGGADPWAPMGPNATHSRPLAPVYVVPRTSHCRAIYSTEFSETEELATTKQAVLSDMHFFATGERLDWENENGSVKTTLNVAVLVLICVISVLL